LRSAALRIFRVARLFKAEQYSQSFITIGIVIKEQRDLLISSIFLTTVILITQATLLWILMHNTNPEIFSSIPQTMWYSILVLTTQGVDTSINYNVWAKILLSLTAIFAVAIIAIPTGVIANGFLNVYATRKQKYEERTKSEIIEVWYPPDSKQNLSKNEPLIETHCKTCGQILIGVNTNSSIN